MYRDWSARQFWYKHIFLAWQSSVRSEYHKILSRKK